MARFKIFLDGKLINTIVSDEAFCRAYCEQSGYAYEFDPEPDPEPVPDPEPTEADDTAAMLVDHEYRLTMIELGLYE